MIDGIKKAFDITFRDLQITITGIMFKLAELVKSIVVGRSMPIPHRPESIRRAGE